MSANVCVGEYVTSSVVGYVTVKSALFIFNVIVFVIACVVPSGV